MYLVDTSVWIDFFKASPNPAVERLKALSTAGTEIGLTATILQEILQGTADDRQFAKYRSYFEAQPIYLPRDPIETAITAACIYFDCRRRGLAADQAYLTKQKPSIALAFGLRVPTIEHSTVLEDRSRFSC